MPRSAAATTLSTAFANWPTRLTPASTGSYSPRCSVASTASTTRISSSTAWIPGTWPGYVGASRIGASASPRIDRSWCPSALLKTATCFNTYVTVTATDDEPPTCACGCVEELAHIRVELTALRAEVERLTAGIAERSPSRPAGSVPAAGARDLAGERLALFQSLFAGREDVYAQRWEKDGRTGWYPQLERLAGQSWQEAKDARRYRPLNDAVVRDHL